jgi:hypothetical protein
LKQDPHIASLAEKHVATDRMLAEAIASPSTADHEIAALKKRKLVLKDRLAAIRSAERTTRH